METARGRWFLAEFARRNRVADTTLLLDAIRRLQDAIVEREPPSALRAVRQSIMEMASEIAQTRREMSELRLDNRHGGGIPGATDALDAVVHGTERATSDILQAAEDMQEIAWKLREQGGAEDLCDALDARATEIYTACSFQDLTGQSIRRVTAVLRRIEDRLDALINDWGLHDIEIRERDAGRPADDFGPARNDTSENSQDDVDLLLVGPDDEIVFADRPRERDRPDAPADHRAAGDGGVFARIAADLERFAGEAEAASAALAAEMEAPEAAPETAREAQEARAVAADAAAAETPAQTPAGPAVGPAAAAPAPAADMAAPGPLTAMQRLDQLSAAQRMALFS